MTLDNNIVGTATQYFERLDKEVDWNETGDENLVPLQEFNLVEDIISLQVSFWCLRRLRNSCESISDNLYTQMRNKIREYEVNFNKEFINPNKEKIW